MHELGNKFNMGGSNIDQKKKKKVVPYRMFSSAMFPSTPNLSAIDLMRSGRKVPGVTRSESTYINSRAQEANLQCQCTQPNAVIILQQFEYGQRKSIYIPFRMRLQAQVEVERRHSSYGQAASCQCETRHTLTVRRQKLETYTNNRTYAYLPKLTET